MIPDPVVAGPVVADPEMLDAGGGRFGGVVGRTAGESTPWWPSPVRPPEGSPNVVLVLLDDMGFSDIGPYGSEIPTPTLDRLAADGIRFTNYHTTPLCSPSRAAIQTGMNPHRAGFAGGRELRPRLPRLDDGDRPVGRDAPGGAARRGLRHLSRSASGT